MQLDIFCCESAARLAEKTSASECLSLKFKSFLIRERVNETGVEYCDEFAGFFLFFLYKLIEVPVECLKIEWVCGVIRTHGKTVKERVEVQQNK